MSFILLQYVDEETGEIDPKAFEKLKALGKTKEEIMSSSMESYHNFNDLSKLISDKIKRLQNLKKIYDTTSDSIKNILSKFIPEGEKIYSEDYMISWRKSSIVALDSFSNIEDVEELFPEFVRVTKELKKPVIKNFAKNGGKLPSILKIIDKQNIQIK